MEGGSSRFFSDRWLFLCLEASWVMSGLGNFRTPSNSRDWVLWVFFAGWLVGGAGVWLSFCGLAGWWVFVLVIRIEG